MVEKIFFSIFWFTSMIIKLSYSSKALLDIKIDTGKDIPTFPLGSTSYVIYRKSLPWIEARRICETTIGRLAIFIEEKDGQSVIDEIRKISIPYSETYDRAENEHEFGMDRRYWFGLSDIGWEGDWTWMDDGSKLKYSSLWYPNQPDHVRLHKLEHCAALWNPIYYLRESHSWNDEPCENKLYFICEKVKDKTMRAGRFIKERRIKRITSTEPTSTQKTTKTTSTEILAITATPTTMPTTALTTTPSTTPLTTPSTTLKTTPITTPTTPTL